MSELIFDKETCDPAFSLWQDIINSNKKLKNVFSENRETVRRQLLAKAAEFTQYLNNKSVSHTGRKILSGQSDNSNLDIIMSGHQPVIYHHGLLYKNHLLNQAAKNAFATGINLIIDTDEGNTGTIVYPALIDGQPAKKRTDLSKEQKPFMFQRLPDKKIISEFFALAGNAEFTAFYEKLSDLPVVEAHTIARRIYQSDCHYLEIPLSKVLEIPEVKTLISKIISDYRNFSEIYNQTLINYRHENNLKNKANPFPDLEINQEYTELPFWLISNVSESRYKLLIKNSSEGIVISADNKNYSLKEAEKEFLIVPKAALITLISRLLLSDLFIHGTGGAKYDQFTDNFIKNYYKISAPAYATATADRYYFTAEIKAYETAKNNFEERRRINFHAGKYLDVFASDKVLQGKISALTQQKDALIEKIKEGKAARQSTAEFTQEIKKIESELKSLIESFMGPAPEFKEPSRVFIDTIYSRDFTFFTV